MLGAKDDNPDKHRETASTRVGKWTNKKWRPSRPNIFTHMSIGSDVRVVYGPSGNLVAI